MRTFYVLRTWSPLNILAESIEEYNVMTAEKDRNVRIQLRNPELSVF